MSEHEYRVVVTREGDAWLAEVPSLPPAHTDARNLTTLDRYVREVIVLAADLPDNVMDELQLDWEFHTGDTEMDEELAALRRHRTDADRLRSAVELETSEAARRLQRRGFSVRDTGTLLGVSPARAQQLLAS